MPYKIHGNEISIGVSLGVALLPYRGIIPAIYYVLLTSRYIMLKILAEAPGFIIAVICQNNSLSV
jgi:hypothetical protein